ncbi:MAG: hypothetical protein STSR0009_04360 [Methanoregula sp.]
MTAVIDKNEFEGFIEFFSNGIDYREKIVVVMDDVLSLVKQRKNYRDHRAFPKIYLWID